MPIGYLVSVTLIAWFTLFAVAPPRPRRSSPTNISFFFGFLLNELPFAAFVCLLADTWLAVSEGDLASPGSRAIAGALVALVTVGLVVVVRRGLQAGPALDQALRAGLGDGWRVVDAGMTAPLRPHLPLFRILLAPFYFRRRDVERVANISYGEAGAHNRLDLYRHRSRPPACPTLVYLHGGAFRHGSKKRGAQPLIYRLASQGWVCISANYRLSPAATFPDHLTDVKKVIAWVRRHGPRYGADAEIVVVAGSSAGGHLAALAALTANDPAFQPGFERVDTAVTAAIALGGYFGPVDTRLRRPSSPVAYVGAHAPPFFIAHGDQDTVVLVDDARSFVEQLRCASRNPVVYAELPGAQHAFDLFHSIRFDTVVAAIEAFTAWVRTRQVQQR
jgi:acetyl esterase/lipase